VSYASGTALNENGREQACLGVAIGDDDGDGRHDIHLTNFSDEAKPALPRQRQFTVLA
jgi:hypothetical protein